MLQLAANDAEPNVPQRILGLRLGADDYITKPFSTKVLLAMIDAVLRRAYPASPEIKEILQAGPVRVFPSRRQAFAEGEPVDLTPAEFTILMSLLKAGGDILSREKLRIELGSVDQSSNERVVDVHVSAMRKKLGNSRKIIKTVHGKGYRIVI